ncbi:potassium channel protein [candidate division WOR-3 bacterium]|nr:potassium channel protein [candidate division WOR-3 bacterium]
MVHKQVAAIIILITIVIVGGTVGYRIIEGWPYNEALYMTIITISTVGFQEVRPLSVAGRLFTILLILSGIVIIATSANFIYSSIIKGTFGDVFRRQRMEKKLNKIRDHFIICGLGAVGEDIIQEFVRAGEPFVLIDKQKDTLEKIVKENPDMLHVLGNATEDEVLNCAGLDKAKGIIAVLSNDADNLYICLSARALNPKLRIISRAIDSESIDKLKKAGADYVFSPEKIGGIRLAAAALRPAVTSFLDTILRGEHLNLVLEEVTVQERSPVVGKTLKQTEITKNIGIIILAIKSSQIDKLSFNPSSDTVINPGDTLISFGAPEQMTQLRKMCSSAFKIM